MPLYKNTVTKDLVVTLKGWAEYRDFVKNYKPKSTDSQRTKDQMYMQDRILTTLENQPLKDVLAKTYLGARALAIQEGKDPDTVKDPGLKFRTSTEDGRRTKIGLSADWVKSLCLMYERGMDVVPQLGPKQIKQLDTIAANNKVIFNSGERLDDKDVPGFLKMMEGAGVSVAYASAPKKDDLSATSKLLTESMSDMDGVFRAEYEAIDTANMEYHAPPVFAGAELDKEVRALSSEYGPAPGPEYQAIPAPAESYTDLELGSPDQLTEQFEGVAESPD